jgi:Arc/MetJ family transcription regulator
MTRMSVTVDERLIERAGEALGTSTKAETIRVALSEVLRRRQLKEALRHRGSIDLDLDQGKLRRLREEG